MKAARLYAYDEHMHVDLTLEMVPEPTITAADEVIVRVGAAGLCRTDLHIIEGVWRGAMDPQGTLLPYILGHENAGWVEDVGSGVHAVKPGDAVICHPLRTCGVCPGCRRGEDMYCARGLFPGLNADGLSNSMSMSSPWPSPPWPTPVSPPIGWPNARPHTSTLAAIVW